MSELKTITGSNHTLMPLLSSAYAPGRCLETAMAVSGEKEREIALGEYHYFSGHPKEAAAFTEPFLADEDINLQLSACFVYGYANLAMNRIPDARHALDQISMAISGMNEKMSPQDRNTALFFARSAATLLHLPLEGEIPQGAGGAGIRNSETGTNGTTRRVTETNGTSQRITETNGATRRSFEQETVGEIHRGVNLNLLSPGMRLFGCYVRAHQAYLKQDYSRSLGIIDTAIELTPEVYPIPMIYLHLAATMDYMGLKQSEQAKEHLLAAWELARPDDLLEPFGEHHGLLGGTLEAVIKKDWPEEFRRMISITYDFSAGWRKIHNPDTGDEVADNLTTTEFAIAMLASRNWTNQEIAAHMGISANTVKWNISVILNKLGLERRSDLKKRMLR